jgi:hypothetical protein
MKNDLFWIDFKVSIFKIFWSGQSHKKTFLSNMKQKKTDLHLWNRVYKFQLCCKWIFCWKFLYAFSLYPCVYRSFMEMFFFISICRFVSIFLSVFLSICLFPPVSLSIRLSVSFFPFVCNFNCHPSWLSFFQLFFPLNSAVIPFFFFSICLLLHLSVVLFSIFQFIYQSNLILIWNFDAYVIRVKGFSIQKFVSRAVGTFLTYIFQFVKLIFFTKTLQVSFNI